MLDGVLEAHALLNGLRGSARALEQTQRLVDVLLAELAAGVGVEHGGRRLLSRRHVAATAAEMRKGVVGLERKLGSAVDQMDRELRQLCEPPSSCAWFRPQRCSRRSNALRATPPRRSTRRSASTGQAATYAWIFTSSRPCRARSRRLYVMRWRLEQSLQPSGGRSVSPAPAA